jgi:hypothetical protein
MIIFVDHDDLFDSSTATVIQNVNSQNSLLKVGIQRVCDFLPQDILPHDTWGFKVAFGGGGFVTLGGRVFIVTLRVGGFILTLQGRGFIVTLGVRGFIVGRGFHHNFEHWMMMKRNWNRWDLVAKRTLFIVQSSNAKNFTLAMKNGSFFWQRKKV